MEAEKKAKRQRRRFSQELDLSHSLLAKSVEQARADAGKTGLLHHSDLRR